MSGAHPSGARCGGAHAQGPLTSASDRLEAAPEAPQTCRTYVPANGSPSPRAQDPPRTGPNRYPGRGVIRNVSVLLGNGLGGFAAPSTFGAGPSPRAVLLADVNGDTRLDLLVANNQGASIAVLFGNGAGGLATAVNYPSGSSPLAIASGDLNHDGALDVVVANDFPGTASVLLGDGQGHFGAPTSCAVGERPRAVARGDLDGDGNLDLATANLLSSFVSVRFGDGTGAFGTSASLPIGFTSYGVALGDLDADGHLDVAAVSATADKLNVLLGDGHGAFLPSLDFGAGSGANSIALRDLNGDDLLDVVVTNGASGKVSVLLNREGCPPIAYCSAKVNSLGCTPSITVSGTPSASAGDGFTISCGGVLNQTMGLLFYGVSGPAAAPFQGGTRCVARPLRRTVMVLSRGTPAPASDCSGVYTLDVNAFAASDSGGRPIPQLKVPGTTIHAQWWGRDPGFAPPDDIALSEGVRFTICP